ncbi:MAG TPA: type II secretion system protein [Geopsychrobacteraceae bacterium]|jgi:general secretion pathway protein G
MQRRRISKTGNSGLTLMELVIATAILAILASVVLPMAEVTVQRTKEIELRRALREIRSAIDAYKADFDEAVEKKKITTSIDETGYPETLEVLVEGKDWGGIYPYKKKYLRRLPRDPFDEYELGWGLRSSSDDHDSSSWGGEDVYDAYSQSDKYGLDGTPYRSW